MYRSCIIKIISLHGLFTRQTVKCGYHLQYQQPVLLVLFLALHRVSVYWLFVVELFVFSGSVTVMVPPVDPLSVQQFMNTGHLS